MAVARHQTMVRCMSVGPSAHTSPVISRIDLGQDDVYEHIGIWPRKNLALFQRSKALLSGDIIEGMPDFFLRRLVHQAIDHRYQIIDHISIVGPDLRIIGVADSVREAPALRDRLRRCFYKTIDERIHVFTPERDTCVAAK